MSEMRVDQPESLHFSAEAIELAASLVEEIKGLLDEDIPTTGLRLRDLTNREHRDSDRSVQAELGDSGFIYFGHTRKLAPHLYTALLSGYAPSDTQIAAESDGGGHNFLWDEILQLSYEHPDIEHIISSNGYDSHNTPILMPYPGACALPEVVLTQVLAIMYERGREYREFGWGFPWISDEIPLTQPATNDED